MEPCPAGGRLDPCAKCHGRGTGIIGGIINADGRTIPYEEDIPGAYARKYENSITGYPHGVFKTEDGIIRDKDGHKMSDNEVLMLLDDARRRRDTQRELIQGKSVPRLEEMDYLGQLELEVQSFEVAYNDASSLEYLVSFHSAKNDIPPIEPDMDDESFYEKHESVGILPKLIELKGTDGKPFKMSSTHLSDLVNTSLLILNGGYFDGKSTVNFDADWDTVTRELNRPDNPSSPVDELTPDYILERNRVLRQVWRKVPPAQRPQQGHLQPLTGVGWNTPEQRQALGDYLGIDDPVKLQRIGTAIDLYCAGHEFYDMKASMQAGNPSDMARAVEEYIACAPKWEGGPTYRAVVMNDQQIDELMRLAGQRGEYDPHFGGTGSWTSTSEIASSWTNDLIQKNQRRGHPDRNKKVMFSCETQRQGTSIAHMSHFGFTEAEVLVSGKARYRIVRTSPGSDGILHVSLEEIE